MQIAKTTPGADDRLTAGAVRRDGPAAAAAAGTAAPTAVTTLPAWQSPRLSPEPAGPLVWRIPAYQPALLMLVLCAAAALNIYGHPGLAVRIGTLAIGLACGGLAVVALRLQLVATDDGVALRTALSQLLAALVAAGRSRGGPRGTGRSDRPAEPGRRQLSGRPAVLVPADPAHQ